ncbi:MAG: XrtV sorting system accessory protein [Parvularculaceae bacterium]
MTSVFDLLAVSLFVAAAGLFLVRFRHEDPPIAPYLLIAAICAVSNWLGENGGGLAAVALLSAASFLLLHLASLPYKDDVKDAKK